MKTPLRIFALIIIIAGLGACGRTEQSSPSQSTTPSKQSELSEFSYQDFIPLVQMSESFVQVANGILKTKFALQVRPHTNINFMRVMVNGVVLTEGYSVSSINLVFDVAPVAGAQIAVSYDPENLRESVAVRPLVMPANLDLESIRAGFNDHSLFLEDLRMARNANGEIILDPSALVFDYQDSYQLIHNRGLHLEISALKNE